MGIRDEIRSPIWFTTPIFGRAVSGPVWQVGAAVFLNRGTRVLRVIFGLHAVRYR